MTHVLARPRDPKPVDVYVGARIRARRRVLGLSQERLAAELELTFQQVQKYERGANRVSASKLYAIAETLGVDPGWFFPTREGGAPVPEHVGDRLLGLAGGAELAELYVHLSPAMRDALLRIARAMDDGGAVLAAGSAAEVMRTLA